MLDFDAFNAEGVRHRDAVPPSVMGALLRFLLHGIPTGSFTNAMLKNAPIGTVLNLADDVNRNHLFGIYCFIANQLPSGCRDVYGWSTDHKYRKRILNSLPTSAIQRAERELERIEK